jgi:hypothetical protein
MIEAIVLVKVALILFWTLVIGTIGFICGRLSK